MYTDNWRKHFRYSTFRQGQEKALIQTAKFLDGGMKYVVGELPTGLGKSDIAMALARASGNAFVVTTQNILIDQYKKDFGRTKGFAHIMGRGNYECEAGYSDCSTGYKKRCTMQFPKESSRCTYIKARDKAKQSPIVFTNLAYYGLGCGDWGQRKLCIIDEAHRIADEVMSRVSMTISDYWLERLMLGTRLPDFEPGHVNPKHFERFVQELHDDIADLLEMEGSNMLHMQEELKTLMDRCHWYLESISQTEWIVDYVKDKNGIKAEARPLDTAYFAQKMFFTLQAEQFVLQSATIIDPGRYCKELGIAGNGMYFKSRSPFPSVNRPIYPLNACKLGRFDIESSLPKLADTVTRILKAHPEEKGIIHTNSYKISKYIEDHVWDTRLIFARQGETADSFEEHRSSNDPTVLVSPALTEGIDGKDDLVRFQVVCKLPYPFLGDRRVQLLAGRDPGWYNYQTAKTLIQTFGRGVRSETDWCRNYVLDSSFDNFIKSANIGSYVNDCVQSPSDGRRLLNI